MRVPLAKGAANPLSSTAPYATYDTTTKKPVASTLPKPSIIKDTYNAQSQYHSAQVGSPAKAAAGVAAKRVVLKQAASSTTAANTRPQPLNAHLSNQPLKPQQGKAATGYSPDTQAEGAKTAAPAGERDPSPLQNTSAAAAARNAQMLAPSPGKSVRWNETTQSKGHEGEEERGKLQQTQNESTP